MELQEENTQRQRGEEEQKVQDDRKLQEAIRHLEFLEEQEILNRPVKDLKDMQQKKTKYERMRDMDLIDKEIFGQIFF